MPLLRRISNATEFSMMLYRLDCACINEAGLGDDDDPGMIPRRRTKSRTERKQKDAHVGDADDVIYYRPPAPPRQLVQSERGAYQRVRG